MSKVANILEQFESQAGNGTNYTKSKSPQMENERSSSPRSIHSDCTGYYDVFGEDQPEQSFFKRIGDFEDSGISEEELKHFEAYDPALKRQAYVMEKSNMRKKRASTATAASSFNDYDNTPYYPKPKQLPGSRERLQSNEGSSQPRRRSEERYLNKYNDYDTPVSRLQLPLERTRSKSLNNIYDDSSETDSTSSMSRSPRQQVLRIGNGSTNVSKIVHAINLSNSSPDLTSRSSSPTAMQRKNTLEGNWSFQKPQRQWPQAPNIPSRDTDFKPIHTGRKAARQENDEVDLGEHDIWRRESPRHSRQSSFDLGQPMSGSYRNQVIQSENKASSLSSNGSRDQDDMSHVYEHLSDARTYKVREDNSQINYEELVPRSPSFSRTGMNLGDSIELNTNIRRSSSSVEADMYTHKKSPSGSQISNSFTRSSNMNYKLTVAVEEDVDAAVNNQKGACNNFYIILAKWTAAILIALTVLLCVTTNKLCLLIIGKEHSISSKNNGKKESIVIMLIIILMVPQAISLFGAIWSKRKSQPWPRRSAVLWIIIGGILEGFCLSYLCLYASTVLSKHPEVFLLFVSGLFVVPTIIQVYQTALKFNEEHEKRRFALFLFAATLQVSGLVLLIIQKGMPDMGDKIGIPMTIGILSLVWSPKLRSLQTEAQVSPRHPRRVMSVDDLTENDVENNYSMLRSRTGVSQNSTGTLDTPESLLKPSAREKAALVMSLVLLIVTPLASLAWIKMFDLGDISKFYAGFSQINSSNPAFWYFLLQLFVTFLGYHAAWLACSIYAQQLAFALPLTLTTPLALMFIEIKQLCNASWLSLTCGPQKGESLYYLIGIAALLLLGQFLSNGYYVWANKGYIMGKASHLFWVPSYTGVLLEPFLLLNRRNKVTDDSHVSSRNLTRQTYVFICSTMYHEELYEMEQLLESIHDVDNNVKKAKRHVESHIFFDGCIKADVMNNYILQLATIIKKTLKVELSQAKKIRTPYGMQLHWVLPGGLPITIHMKDNLKVKNKKRWSQIMYMSYVLDYKQRCLNVSDDQTFILTTDADVHFTHDSMEALIDYMVQDERIGAVCGRTHPMGNGPLVWYQNFDYAVGHWFMKVANHVLGSVLCCPGCFSLYRCKAVRDVLPEYSTNVNEAFEFLTKDMGEDRWFCTLMVEKGWRLAYCAAAEDRTYCPQEFEEFYKQRRRWMPSTLANLSLLVSKWRMVIGNNENISFGFVLYQVMLLLATLIGPSIVILFVVGGLVSLNREWNEDVIVILMSIVTIGYAMICLFFSQDIQIKIAKLLTFVCAIIMIMVTIGLCLQISREINKRKSRKWAAANSNGTITLTLEERLPAGVSTLYLGGLSAIFILTAFLHPKEMLSLLNGIWYLLCLPSGYLLLTIYSVVNMTDRSWGTREGKTNAANGQAENPMATLWKTFKAKCACCFNLTCCQDKPKSDAFKSRGNLARTISSKFRDRINRNNGRDKDDQRRGRRRQKSRTDEDSETSSNYSGKSLRHSVNPRARGKSKHPHDNILERKHADLRVHRDCDRELSNSSDTSLADVRPPRTKPKPRRAQNGSVKKLKALFSRNMSEHAHYHSGKPTIAVTVAEEGPVDYEDDAQVLPEVFGEIGRRGYNGPDSPSNDTQENTLERSSDNGYHSNTPSSIIKRLPLRTEENGSRLSTISQVEVEDDGMSVATTVDDLLNDVCLDMPVEEWLKGDLRPYVDNFKKHGYDTIQFISGMTEKDLQDIGIEVRGHRQKLKRVTQNLPRKIIEEGIPCDVKDWLLDLGLIQYWPYFVENIYTEPNDLEDLKRMTKDQLKTTFHIEKVAHLNMFMQGIKKLQYANKGQKEIREARRELEQLPMLTLRPKNEHDPALEYRFWEQLRHQCLMPELAGFDANTELKEKLAELRNSALMMFFVANCLWMIIIMVLVKQASLKALGVDILGLSFLLLYGAVTFLQFLAMIAHRLTTLLHVLARAPWTCCSRKKDDFVGEQVNAGYIQDPL